MICNSCNKRLEECPCPETPVNLESLKKCSFIDPQMIANIQMARAANKSLIAANRTAANTKSPQ